MMEPHADKTGKAMLQANCQHVFNKGGDGKGNPQGNNGQATGKGGKGKNGQNAKGGQGGAAQTQNAKRSAEGGAKDTPKKRKLTEDEVCPLHKGSNHTLAECKSAKKMGQTDLQKLNKLNNMESTPAAVNNN